MKYIVLSLASAASFISASTHAELPNINVSAIINTGYTHRDDFSGVGLLQLDEHSQGLKQGFSIDHSELTFSSAIDDLFYGKLSLALDEHDDDTEIEVEEAYLQTLTLPYDLSFRVGRFLSNVGYLNSKHTHTDNFSDRPLAYRTFLSNHYLDDGARFSWLLPTDTYIEVGAEIFKGGKLPAFSSGDGIGSYTIFSKIGGDFNQSNSWQLGASFLSVDNDEGECSLHQHGDDEHAEESHDEEEHGNDEHFEEHDDHMEGISVCDFSGDQKYFMVDAVWKWAPNGNYKYQNFTLSSEYFFVNQDGELHHEEEEHDHDDHHDEDEHSDEIHAFDKIDVDHHGFYVSGVYQFSPQWASGLRYSQVDLEEPYSEHHTPKVSSVMLEWRRSHFSTVRLQFNHDESVKDSIDNQINLQFTMALGAHNAHQF